MAPTPLKQIELSIDYSTEFCLRNKPAVYLHLTDTCIKFLNTSLETGFTVNYLIALMRYLES